MRALLFMTIAIGVAAVGAPKLLTHYANAGKPVAAASAAPHIAPGPRQVTIEARRDGHFYVEADINFRPVSLMVDTGASVVALRESDAAAAGIRLHPSDFQHPVQTANGETRAAEAQLESVAVGDIEVEGVRALIIPDAQLAISLLGASFLNRLARFEVAEGTLIFEK
jgi:aspartyl protease family protein